jgi:hypothetical protein
MRCQNTANSCAEAIDACSAEAGRANVLGDRSSAMAAESGSSHDDVIARKCITSYSHVLHIFEDTDSRTRAARVGARYKGVMKSGSNGSDDVGNV